MKVGGFERSVVGRQSRRWCFGPMADGVCARDADAMLNFPGDARHGLHIRAQPVAMNTSGKVGSREPRHNGGR